MEVDEAEVSLRFLLVAELDPFAVPGVVSGELGGGKLGALEFGDGFFVSLGSEIELCKLEEGLAELFGFGSHEGVVFDDAQKDAFGFPVGGGSLGDVGLGQRDGALGGGQAGWIPELVALGRLRRHPWRRRLD